MRFDLEVAPGTRASRSLPGDKDEEFERNESNGLDWNSTRLRGRYLRSRSPQSGTPLGSFLAFYSGITLVPAHTYLGRSLGLALASTAFNEECLGFVSLGRRASLAFKLSPQRSTIGDRRYQIPDTRYNKHTTTCSMPRSPDPHIPTTHIPQPATKRSPYGPSVNTHN